MSPSTLHRCWVCRKEVSIHAMVSGRVNPGHWCCSEKCAASDHLLPVWQQDEAAWIAARQAQSLAHREMYQWVLAATYDDLPEELRLLRQRYDRAAQYVSQLQALRATAGAPK